MALSAATLESPFPGTDSNPRRVAIIRGIDPLIITICPLWGCLLEVIVTVEDIIVVDGHHFVAANFDGQLLHDGATQVLNHSPVGIFAGQRDRGDQPRGPGDNHIVLPRLGTQTSSCWFWSMLPGWLVMTTDCRTPLTPKGSRRGRYGLSCRPNLLGVMLYLSCAAPLSELCAHG